ncbi:mannose-6-phosphate isomerase, class I [Allonocardiopsis opalescens]|uniref:mannose-6-phosphate isomerase n=1 Tax=Allonocardiopsis opalescens TaxID=1144618 RepID=A0A2T0Q4P2_9ACTN|nr:mannose-6-phosphate isomerase, class I [Allonocardiopsis opalescens]PRX98671.1 mannose-6-phosphate isomerase type 1 [Allonocardiopsis opalescens]
MRPLRNQVRRYAWGSPTAIPALLGAESDGGPQAELWLGAHPGAPSEVVGDDVPGGVQPLDAYIAADPAGTLGAATAERFGARLPFLLKLLAAEQPLSLQAHPDEARARAGYAAEEDAGVPRDAAHRNYRDPHHKPEMVVALEPFEALCGFRDPARVREALAGLDAPLAAALREDLAAERPDAALRAAFTRLLTLPEEGRAGLVAQVVDGCRARLGAGSGDAHDRCVSELAERYPGDPGAVAAFLLNLVTLAPGEALFLPAGNVHAYLRGTGVEIMAGSDNVLRAGLTGKHVDPAELLDVVDFAVLPVPYVEPRKLPGGLEYRPGAAEFALRIVDLDAAVPETLPEGGPAVVLVLDGAALLRSSSGGELLLERGSSAFLDAADGPVTATGSGRMVAASVPQDADPAA